jgi:hypothetical protein
MISFEGQVLSLIGLGVLRIPIDVINQVIETPFVQTIIEIITAAFGLTWGLEKWVSLLETIYRKADIDRGSECQA